MLRLLAAAALIALTLGCTADARAKQPSCVVERVIDGDTFVCDSGTRVRLLQINAPELKACGGEWAGSRPPQHLPQARHPRPPRLRRGRAGSLRPRPSRAHRHRRRRRGLQHQHRHGVRRPRKIRLLRRQRQVPRLGEGVRDVGENRAMEHVGARRPLQRRHQLRLESLFGWEP